MPAAAELTPHLAAAMPRLAALVPWLLSWGATVIVLALAASVFIVRGASSRSSGDGGTMFSDAERRLRRARRLLLIALASLVALWGVMWLAGGPDPLLTELIFAVLVAGLLGPTYVAMRIFERAMTRAAARMRERPGAPPSASPRGGERPTGERD